MQTKLPIEYSYKITETFYAGEYPFSKEPQSGKVKLKRLIDFGIKHFIDLTSERLTKYSEFLPTHCTYTNLPTTDYTVPDFRDLKEAHIKISEAERRGEKIYIHCKGGYDRTGVAVATYFIHQGKTADEAKRFYLEKADKIRTRYPHQPLIETRWEVLDEYEQFLKQCQITEKYTRLGIRLTMKPETVIDDVLCPFCKKEALGTMVVNVREGVYLYQLGCFNADCIENYQALSPLSIDSMVRNVLEIKKIDEKNTVDTSGTLKDKIFGGILGLAVADALGVPVEFQDRKSLLRKPVTDMRGYGTYKQPPGTWSDDTSLTLCLLDSLAKKGFNARWRWDENFPEPDYTDIMQKFLSWMYKEKYTAHDEVFDVGIATRKALQRFRDGNDPLDCGGTTEQDNGNGSLMRILPIAFYLHRLIEKMSRYAPGGRPASVASCFIHNISSLTHAHKRCHIACGIYVSVVLLLLSEDETDLNQAIKTGVKAAKEGFYDNEEYAKELKHYKRLYRKDFAKLPEEEIKSSGYVVDTLEAALWCLLNTDNYEDCVLKAVNLGEDTDTVAAVAGGLAGMFYGVDGIPGEWLGQLARRDYIEELCEGFYRSLGQWTGDE